MTKRRVFDIEFPEDEQDPGAARSDNRRGPMAAAISENADAVETRAATERAIRQENDRLAHDYVWLRQMGLVNDLLPIDGIKTSKLARDRKAERDPEIDDLKKSILAIGLSNPIRVEADEGGIELIQGFRRLTAFRELYQETKDERFARIPAAVLAAGETLEGLYRRMVDENLVRRDVSFAEMAQLAMKYASDPATEASDIDGAITHLYPSVARQKRNYIGHFATLMGYLGTHLSYPEAIPRALGLELEKRLSAKKERIGWLQALLIERQAQSAVEEVKVLRDYLASLAAPDKKAQRGSSRAGAKTTIRYDGPGGLVRCKAADGRIELQAERDFSILDRRQIEAALDAFFKALDGTAED